VAPAFKLCGSSDRAHVPRTYKTDALRWLGPARAAGNSLKAFERIGILANEEYQRGSLRIGFGATLLPFLESSEVDA
jgi:hypothetical protein